jgi:hypothetical protein
MQPTHSILLAEEDAAARSFLADNLIADGYRPQAGGHEEVAAMDTARIRTGTQRIILCVPCHDAVHAGRLPKQAG